MGVKILLSNLKPLANDIVEVVVTLDRLVMPSAMKHFDF
jgi:hypothetical protein